ncbi:MAG: metallophosphoesterase family protein [Akkermansia sp.]|nr:metallophosphoesterase family protein [Akkermansia sp.]
MKVAVLSDIHANLEALQAVLSDAAQLGAEEYAGLGDVIGFNGDPAACVEMVMPLLNVAVRGNHEEALLQRGLFGVPLYTAMMDRTAAMLGAELVARLRPLPRKASRSGITYVHASPATEGWQRIATVPEAREAFTQFGGNLCFFGHTHRPAIFSQKDGKVNIVPVVYGENASFTLQLEADCRYLINPGSVGQPRDLDYRAAYGIYDTESSTLTLRRVDYDVEAAAAKIARTGLPDSFAADLKRGHTPTGD